MLNRAQEWDVEDTNGQCPAGFCSTRNFMRAVQVYGDME